MGQMQLKETDVVRDEMMSTHSTHPAEFVAVIGEATLEKHKKNRAKSKNGGVCSDAGGSSCRTDLTVQSDSVKQAECEGFRTYCLAGCGCSPPDSGSTSVATQPQS